MASTPFDFSNFLPTAEFYKAWADAVIQAQRQAFANTAASSASQTAGSADTASAPSSSSPPWPTWLWMGPGFGFQAEDLEKRIEELKVFLFWIQQTQTGLLTLLQLLETQKMAAAAMQTAHSRFTAAEADPPTGAQSSSPTAKAQATAQRQETEANPPKQSTQETAEAPGATEAKIPPLPEGAVQAMQAWQQLTQQFGEVARTAFAAHFGTAPSGTATADSTKRSD